MELGMRIGDTPKSNPQTEGLNFDLSQTEPDKNGEVEVKAPEKRPEVEETLSKNKEGEIVVPEPKKGDKKPEGGEIEKKDEEPQGLTPIASDKEDINKDKSSLTQPESKTTEEIKSTPAEIDDQAVLSYLNEKYGKEYDNLDNFQEKTAEVKSSLDDNPYLKGLVEWQERTGRPIEDYVKFQKDYNEMSDLQVVREYLQVKYPTLTEAQLSIEMNKYTPTELDVEDDIALKNLELTKLSVSARSELESLKGEFNTPVTPANTKVSPEIQKDLDLLKEIQTNYNTAKADKKVYGEKISEASLNTNVLPLKLSDDLSLNYNINEQGRKEIPTFINEMSHWKNEDGSWNHSAVVNDGIKLKNFDQIIRLVYEQGVNSGKDSLIEQSKNSTLGAPDTQGGSALESQKGAQIEGNISNFTGKRGMTIQLKE